MVCASNHTLVTGLEVAATEVLLSISKIPAALGAAGICLFLKEIFLLTQTERLDDVAVAFDVAALEVVEQSAALTYELNERAFSGMIFTVGSHVVRQMGNTVRKQSHLALNGTRVGVRLSVLAKDLFLLFRIQVHCV